MIVKFNSMIMRKLFSVVCVLIVTLTANAQNYNVTINSQFKPMSFEEHLLRAQAEAVRRAREEEMRARSKRLFEQYQNDAYKALNRGDKSGFLRLSNQALQTGWYNGKLYYDRGKVYQQYGLYRYAKQEFKKAKKVGYYQAEYALIELKEAKRRK